jgi:hypothetical protein
MSIVLAPEWRANLNPVLIGTEVATLGTIKNLLLILNARFGHIASWTWATSAWHLTLLYFSPERARRTATVPARPGARLLTPEDESSEANKPH